MSAPPPPGAGRRMAANVSSGRRAVWVAHSCGRIRRTIAASEPSPAACTGSRTSQARPRGEIPERSGRPRSRADRGAARGAPGHATTQPREPGTSSFFTPHLYDAANYDLVFIRPGGLVHGAVSTVLLAGDHMFKDRSSCTHGSWFYRVRDASAALFTPSRLRCDAFTPTVCALSPGAPHPGAKSRRDGGAHKPLRRRAVKLRRATWRPRGPH